MRRSVNTKDVAAVNAEAQSICRSMFPSGDVSFVGSVFGWAAACFTGQYRDYQPVDIRYHDFEHTLQGTLCLVRLLHGRHRTGVQPVLTERAFQLGLAAILLHDTGYLKTRDDTEGTGAKYTLTHVGRSADFAAQLLREKGFAAAEIEAVQKMICCTGVEARPDAIAFASELERTIGLALATADLLGQMAAPDYVEKLPSLFAEFEEAVRYSGDKKAFIASFASAPDLIARTPAFWEDFVRKKLDRDLHGLYRFLDEPYPDGPNEYLENIEDNIQRLKALLKEPQISLSPRIAAVRPTH